MQIATRIQGVTGAPVYEWGEAALPQNTYWRGVASNGTRAVVIAGLNNYTPKIASYSDDGGATWSVPVTFAPQSDNVFLIGITCTNGLFCIYGYDGAAFNQFWVWMSADGVTWQRYPAPFFARTIASANGKFFLIDTNKVAVSSNGIAWTTYSLASGPGFNISYGGYVAYDGAKYVLQSATHRAVSTDAVSWSLSQITLGLAYGSLHYGGGVFISGAYYDAPNFFVQRSSDGINFTPVQVANFSNMSRGIYTGSKHVLISTGGGNRGLVSSNNGLSFDKILPWPGSSIIGSAAYASGYVIGCRTEVNSGSAPILSSTVIRLAV